MLAMCSEPDHRTGEMLIKYQCLFPDCGRKFVNKRHALRHQNEKHGRQPTRGPHGLGPLLAPVMQ